MSSLPPLLRRAAVAITVAAVAAALVASSAVTVPDSAVARTPATRAMAATRQANPLAGHPWGIYRGPSDKLYPAFQASRGGTRRTMAKLALRPHVRWYTRYIRPNEIAGRIHKDVAQEQHGNPNVLVWMGIFAIWPHNEGAKRQPLTQSDIAAYRAWIRNAVRAIGRTRAAVVLEPDLPVALTGWRPAVRLHLVAWTARLLSRLPNVTTYIGGGAADWLKPAQAARMLRTAGIRYTRGFALGTTHHTGTPAEVRHGRAIVAQLAHVGVRGKHFIVDTSDNGRPYTYGQFYRVRPRGNFTNAPACSARVRRACVTLGIPPSTRVVDRRWPMPRQRWALTHLVDGFAWIARTWLIRNDTRFSLAQSLNIVRYSPYRGFF